MTNFSKRVKSLLASAIGFVTLGACATAPGSVAGKADIENDAALALDKGKTSDPSLGRVLDSSAGYAVFPLIGKGGANGTGGAGGKGVLFEHGQAVGYCDLRQANIGAQLDGRAYTEIIAIENQIALHKFKNGHLNFDPKATAVALKSGAGSNAKYRKGVTVFTMEETGLMFEASVGGQKFTYQAR